MAYGLGTAQGTIRIEYDNRGVARARNDLGQFVSLSDVFGESADRSTDRASRGFASMGASILKATALILAAGAAADILSGAIGGIVVVGQSLIPVITASLATLPGILLAAAGAAAVLKLAMVGVGDTIKAAFAQDASKFAEAIKKLAPEAQAAAKALYGVGAAAKPLQQAVQNAFFAATAPLVEQLIPAIKALTPTLTAVATGFNGILKQVLGFASSPVFIDAVTKSLAGLSQFLTALAPGFTPLLNGFAQLAAQAGKFFASFGDSAGQALAKFGEFLGSLDLDAMWQTAGVVLRNLGTLFKDLGSILGSIVGAFTGAGQAVEDFGGPTQTLANSLGIVVGKLADFLSSAAGMDILHALAGAMSAVASAGGDALLALLSALAPIFVQLSPLIQQIAQMLGATLTAAFAALSPALTTVANALRTSLGPMIPRLTEAFTQLAPVLGQIASVFGGVLGSALSTLLPVLGQLITMLSGVLLGALTQLLPYIQRWGTAFQEVAAQVLPQVLALMQQLGPVFADLIPFIGLGAQMLLTLLVPAMRLMGVVLPVVITALSLFVSVLSVVTGAVGALGSLISSVWNAISSATSGTWPSVGNIVGIAVRTASAAVTAAVGAIKGAISSLSGIGSQIGGYFRAAVSAVQGAVGALMGVVRGIPGQISGALSGLGGLLSGAGASLIQGLINGIRSMAGAAIAAARNVAAQVAGAVKGALGISSPSKVTMALGREVGAGLALGILETARMVERATQTLAGMVPTSLATSVNASVLGSGVGAGASGSTGGQPAFTAPPPAPSGITINQTVHALPGQSAKAVGDSAIQRLVFGVTTGTSGLGPAAPEPGVA